ncbi:amino acid adenylation domain-containing protein [Bacillus spongiae]|uniref:Amino acid adenylation domain-containing protein n=1 Tax=Bacillus spongiae TaxID=2683610 RepID=A0ABU8HIP8_9BACI
MRHSDSTSSRSSSLLQQKLKEKLEGKKKQIVKRSAKERFPPLSFAQQRLWFIDKLQQGSSAYNICLPFKINGAFHLEHFKNSIHTIVQRHEALRTNFLEQEGKAYQLIHEHKAQSIHYVDLSSHPVQDSQTYINNALREEIDYVFDLSHEELFRVRIFKQSDVEHVCIITQHHIISDGWSIDLLFQELQAIYLSFLSGKPHELPEMTVQYADYASWQRKLMEKGDFQKQTDYWKGKLKDHAKKLDLPTDYSRPKRQTFHGKTLPFHIPHQLANELKRVSQEHQSTLFMTLLTAFQILLSRYSNQEDVIVGTPIANRKQKEVQHLLGFFVNTLALRARVEGNKTFQQILNEVRETTLEAFMNQDVPFEKIVEEVVEERDASYSPLFQVMFALNQDSEKLNASDFSLEPIEFDRHTSKFDLMLTTKDTEDGIEAIIEYNTDLFHQSTIKRMSGHFLQLLNQIVLNPAGKIAEYDLLTVKERATIVKEWNETITDYPKDQTIVQLFEAIVDKNPEAIAIHDGNSTVSYRELNEKANRLAHYLNRNYHNEEKIGILLERSPEMIISIIGILKANKAYVPFDRSYPVERIGYMVIDAEVQTIITRESLSSQLPQESTELLFIDQLDHFLSTMGTANLNQCTDSQALAYIMYTSGSTGRPKGVCVNQRNIIRLVKDSNYFTLSTKEVFLQLAPISFDAATFEIWGSLLNGQELVIFPPETPSLETIGEVIHEFGVTTLWLTAGLFHEMVQHNLQGLQPIRQLLAGGDKLNVQSVNKVLQQLPDCRLINGYGPTENTTFTCFHELSLEHGDYTSVPIGRPISNTKVYILDKNLMPVPVGIPGELYIAGDGLSKGYYNQPELTKERFISSPFNTGEILYRSGDLVRYLEDGVIDFIGRIDRQVKIRGFRIELGEVESTILAHKAIQDVVVIDKEEGGEKLLLAYIVWNKGQKISTEQLQQELQQTLPTYMIPTYITPMDVLPLTQNGKIDRKALPNPTKSQEKSLERIEPKDAIEEQMLAIWSDTLNNEAIGVDSNFFRCGGHSLLAARMTFKLGKIFNIELSINTVFEFPTVRKLANVVRQEMKRNQHGTKWASIPKVTRQKEHPLSFAQQRLWVLHQLEPNNPAYNMLVPMKLKGKLDLKALEQALAEMVKRHESLRTTFHIRNGEPYQVISQHLDSVLTHIDYSLVSAEGHFDQLVDQYCNQALSQPYDLEKGPLFKATLMKKHEQEHVLLLEMHHIISDGWSLEVIQRELHILYEAFLKQQPSPLPSLPTQYLDYSVWQKEVFEKEVMEEQMAYWSEQLKGHSYVLKLPVDYPRPKQLTGKGAVYQLKLSKETSKKLKELSNEHNTTLYMTLLTLFNLLLKGYTGEKDILVGTPIANRTHPHVEGLIGYFVNTLVIRTQMQEDMSFVELLETVKNTVTDGFAHQDLPFEKVVDKLRVDRDVSYSPLFQVMFSLQNSTQTTFTMDKLEVDYINCQPETAKFDLSLDMTDTEEGITGAFEYSTDLFSQSTIEKMANHLEVLIHSILKDKEQNVSDVMILDEEEKQQMVYDWNATNIPFPDKKCIHQLFEDSVDKMPNHVAVVFKEKTLTYRELDQKANQLAHYLQERGVGPGVCVAIGIERSLELPISLLAVLKAGGAFLPLDLDAPSKRISQVLKGAEPLLCLVHSHLKNIPNDVVSLVDIHEVDKFSTYPTSRPISEVTSDDLVSIYYTSGSTGKPKGVENVHKGWVNHMTWNQNELKLTCNETVLHKTTLTFDDSGIEFFWTFMVGARVAILEPGAHRDPHAIIQAMIQYNVAVSFFVPSMLNLIIDRISLEERLQLTDLRVVVSGGEALHSETVRKFMERFESELYNTWGATEVSIGSSFHRCTITDVVKDGNVSIGKPIDNHYLYVLNENLQPVPIGVPGDIYIGGIGLARGYYKNSLKTKESFISNPFIEGERMYRTGDRGTFDLVGNIQFLGRADNQVKIRGMRIELGEIEHTLAQHSSVKEAVVVIKEDHVGEKKLVGYAVCYSTQPSSSMELREYLKAKLPGHMVPSFVVTLESFPLNNNGKVDRKALPTPEMTSSEDYVAPRNDTEKIMQNIWRNVLNINKISVKDNFFEMGGHSLKAIVLMDRIEEEFQQRVPLSTLYEKQTVEELCQELKPERTIKDQILVKIQEGEKDGAPLFFAHPVGGGIMSYIQLAKELKEETIYGLQAMGYESDHQPLTDMHEMADLYLSEIQQVQEKGPYRLAGWSFGGNLVFEIAKRLELLGEEVEFIVIIDSEAEVKAVETYNKNRSSLQLISLNLGICNEVEINMNQDLDEDQLLNQVAKKLKALEFFHQDTSNEVMKRKIEVLAANEEAFSHYTTRGIVEADIHVFHVTEVNPHRPFSLIEPEKWRNRTNGQLSITRVEGHHESVLEQPNVSNLVNRIKERLSWQHTLLESK